MTPVPKQAPRPARNRSDEADKLIGQLTKKQPAAEPAAVEPSVPDLAES